MSFTLELLQKELKNWESADENYLARVAALENEIKKEHEYHEIRQNRVAEIRRDIELLTIPVAK